MDPCTCMAESLCCSPEITTTSLIGYTVIQNESLKKLGLESPSEIKKVFSFPLTTSSRQRSCLDLSCLGKNGQGELKEMEGHVAGVLRMLNPDPR